MAETATQSTGPGFGLTALLIAISMVSGAIGAVAIERWKTPPPKIMVLDMPSLIAPISSDPTLTPEQKRQITTELGQALEVAMAQEVEANGNIILDAAVILRAPETSYVRP